MTEPRRRSGSTHRDAKRPGIFEGKHDDSVHVPLSSAIIGSYIP